MCLLDLIRTQIFLGSIFPVLDQCDTRPLSHRDAAPHRMAQLVNSDFSVIVFQI
jgi:hypothetical protein